MAGGRGRCPAVRPPAATAVVDRLTAVLSLLYTRFLIDSCTIRARYTKRRHQFSDELRVLPSRASRGGTRGDGWRTDGPDDYRTATAPPDDKRFGGTACGSKCRDINLASAISPLKRSELVHTTYTAFSGRMAALSEKSATATVLGSCFGFSPRPTPSPHLSEVGEVVQDMPGRDQPIDLPIARSRHHIEVECLAHPK